MDDHRVPGRVGTVSPLRPIHPGDAAALGQRLAGREKWVRVDADGTAELVQVDKQELVQKLWIPFRDLLQLDPEVPIPYPSSIFIRERALVVNLESVRMIIAKDEVYVTSVPVPGSAELWQHPSSESPFVRDLSDRLASDPSKVPPTSHVKTMQSKVDQEMPFELRALEAALAEGVKVLEVAVGNLERAAFPALESLVHNVSRTELDKTRNVKTVTTHLLNRVSRIKKELEEILDDDQDMADMYLGRREELEGQPNQRASLETRRESQRSSHAGTSPSERGQGVAERLDSSSAEYGLPQDSRFVTYDPDDDVLLEEFGPSHRGPRELRTAHPHDIEDCENLLENYFMQAEFLFSRLMQLKERTDDTEDLINIELDQRRNELVSLDLILTALATAFGFVACVGGIFGMNLAPLPIESTEAGFWAATIGASAAGLLLLVGFLGYAYWKKILLIPST